VKTSTIRTCLSFLGCGIALATMAFAQPSAVDLVDRQPIDVCEIARHAERYRDKVVAVSGFYVSGPHGAAIANEHCGFRNRYRAFGRGTAAAVEYDLSAAKTTYNISMVTQTWSTWSRSEGFKGRALEGGRGCGFDGDHHHGHGIRCHRRCGAVLPPRLRRARKRGHRLRANGRVSGPSRYPSRQDLLYHCT
jgi:hypothetical protein